MLLARSVHFRIGDMSLSTNSCFAEHVPDDVSHISDKRSNGPFDDMGRVFYSLTVNSRSVTSRVHFACLQQEGCILSSSVESLDLLK